MLVQQQVKTWRQQNSRPEKLKSQTYGLREKRACSLPVLSSDFILKRIYLATLDKSMLILTLKLNY